MSKEKVGSALEKALQDVFETPNIKNLKREGGSVLGEIQCHSFKVEGVKYYALARSGGQCEIRKGKSSKPFCEFYFTPSGYANNIKYFDVE